MAEAILQAPSVKTNLSRRTILGGALVLPLAAVPAVATAAGTDRVAWGKAFDAYHRAQVAHRCAADAWEAADDRIAAELPPCPLQNVTVDFGGGCVQTFDLMPQDLVVDTTIPAERRQQIKADYEAWVERRRALHAQHHEPELYQDCMKLAEPMHRAHRALMDTPSPDIDALAVKLETAIRHGRLEEHGAVLLADAQRLAGKAVS